jgi:NADPH-dependent curcumin reductase CurA
MRTREIHLIARPKGTPRESDFAVVQTTLPAIGDRQVAIQNIWMSLDPYMRGQMNETCTHSEPFKIGEHLNGDAVGRVIESNHPDFPVGTTVAHFGGWREHVISEGSDLRVIEEADVPLRAHLGVLGMTGMTAYTAVFLVSNLQPGETIFVSAAAGAVGSVVCQLAKLHGCRVVASAGSDEKLEWLKIQYGVDCTINYRTTPDFTAALRAACPNGLEVYIDSVGGVQLEAALEAMNHYGRVVACGMISFYNDGSGHTGPRNYILVGDKRLKVSGMNVWAPEYWQRYPAFVERMIEWIRSGAIRVDDTVVTGLENAPRAFIGMLAGANKGKALVHLSE